jgi:hypothetical protein
MTVCADLGTAPSTADIDQVRREEWASFPREDIFVIGARGATVADLSRNAVAEAAIVFAHIELVLFP